MKTEPDPLLQALQQWNNRRNDFGDRLRLLMEALQPELSQFPPESDEWRAVKAELDGYERACRQGAAGYYALSWMTFQHTIAQATAYWTLCDAPDISHAEDQ